MPPREGPRAATRVIDILGALARERSSMTLTQLSQALDAPKASMFTLIAALTKREILTRDAADRYQLGPAAMRLAMIMVSSRSFTDITHPFLLKLARKVGETALIGCLEPQSLKVVYVDKAESESAVRYTVPVGFMRDLHCSSVGKIVLAYRPDVATELFKSSRLTRFTGGTVVDKKVLTQQLQTVRTEGIAKTVDEATLGASGIAAPIFNRAGVLVAGLVVAGPTQRVRPDIERIEREVRATARALSLALPETSESQIAMTLEDVIRNRPVAERRQRSHE
jgi:DNA-binding IclR family transcriptional regulator